MIKPPRIGIASRPKPGELVCGDHAAYVADRERLIVVVADGVGHGPAAASAARSAVELALGWPSADPAAILDACDKALVRTRGAAVAVLRVALPGGEVSFAGVGNVEVTGVTAENARLLSVPGIVGSRVGRAVVTRHRAWPGDLLVLHTDGVTRRFRPEEVRDLEPQIAADSIVERHGRLHDDATCVVLRF